MTKHWRRWLSPTLAALALLSGLLLATGSTRVQGAELTELEQAGRRLFLRGESPSGARLDARIGMAGLTLSGAAVACGNCHGEDGRGRAESGVVPPDIRWSELVKPYGHHHDSGRRHGPFDEQSLHRAVFEGLDPAGNQLGPAMPRYEMSARDFSALVAYLRKLEFQRDPGVGEQVLRIGTLLPAGGRQGELATELRTLWTAWFARINERGGIHGRRLELVVEPLPVDVDQARAGVRRWLQGADVLAVLAPLSSGIETALADAAQTQRVPVIGPLTLYPEDPQASVPQVFHLLPGITELTRVLLRQAASESRLTGPTLLWYPDTAQGLATAQAVEAQLLRDGAPEPLLRRFAPNGPAAGELAADAARRGVTAVAVLGPGADVAGLAQAATPLSWAPRLLVPGPLATRDLLGLPASWRDHTRLAYALTPGGAQASVVDTVADLLGRGDAAALAGTPNAASSATAAGGAPGAQRRTNRSRQDGSPAPAVMTAYAAGLLLVEALERSGNELSRRKLIDTLESVQGFDTGLMPPLSFNADRRIGSLGAYVFAIAADGTGLRPLGGYLTP
ncbi:MAG: hypothetical protein RL375_3988 [Pseudomonadota bacterium]